MDLLAHAYVAAGRFEQALEYARQAFELSQWNAAEQTPFDRAQALGTMCVALRAAGDRAAADEWQQKALAAAEELDVEEREVVTRLVRMSEAGPQ
jgi:tetratricopeptide (TPR) repeat protein